VPETQKDNPEAPDAKKNERSRPRSRPSHTKSV
jgi:hypothetical protein